MELPLDTICCHIPVLHTASFKVFGTKLCLKRDVKLFKNAAWHDLENKVISP